MSEEMRLFLSRELREKTLQEISYNNILTSLSLYRDYLLRCLLERKETCNIVLNEALEIIKDLGYVRVVKTLRGETSQLSFDSSFLSMLDNIIREYYKIMIGSEAPYDEYNRVLVRVLKDFEYNGRYMKKNNIVLLDVAKAVLLESLGFIKIYRIKVFK